MVTSTSITLKSVSSSYLYQTWIPHSGSIVWYNSTLYLTGTEST